MILAVGAAAGAASAQTPQRKPASMERCEELMAFYDMRRGQWPGVTARTNRQFGEIDCRKGNYEAGVKQLEVAIRSFGGVVPD